MLRRGRSRIVTSGVAFAAFALIAGGCGGRPASSLDAAPVTATGDCESLATCYTPRQVEVAYGVLPLLEHGTDGRGETVVLPELAEPQFSLPASDIRRDLAQFDRLFHLPAARVRVVRTLAPSAAPWLANGEEVLDTKSTSPVSASTGECATWPPLPLPTPRWR